MPKVTLKGSKKEKNNEGERSRTNPRGRLAFSYAEDRGSAVRADTLDRSLTVLERDILRVLDLDVGFAFDAICLWHGYSVARPLGPGSI